MSTATTRHEAVWDWLLECPYIGDIFFNAGRAEDGNTVLIPSEQTAQEYIDGSELRWYDVTLTRFEAISTDPNDTANIGQTADIDAIAEWVDEQADSENFPEFPEKCTVMDAKALPNEGGWMVAQDQTQAKYMLQFRIEYIKNK